MLTSPRQFLFYLNHGERLHILNIYCEIFSTEHYVNEYRAHNISVSVLVKEYLFMVG